MFNNFLATLNHLLGKYSINDPTTQDLVVNVPIPQQGLLKYAVKDMAPSPKNINESRSLGCHISIGNCLNVLQKQAPAPVTKWSAVPVLQVFPAAGVEMNAYYDRRSLRFFYYNYRGKNVYFSDSSDIVTHELGHAFLDAMRPDFWSVQSLEVWSFHEAFSDITAMFNLMNYDIVIKKVLAETKGNLLVSNTISRLAEEVGMLIRSVTKDNSYLTNALRDPAVEQFKYVNPSRLPAETTNNALAAECHSFGRVFSNAWYNIFVRIFNHHISLKNDPTTAFKTARDASFSIMIQAIPMSARTVNYYSSIAKSMVSMAKSKSPKYAEIVKSVFVEWNILSPSDVQSLSNTSWKKVISGLNKEDVVFKNSKVTVVCVKDKKFIPVGDLPMASSLSEGNFEVEVASDSYYEFDNKGKLTNEILPSDADMKAEAAMCVLAISDKIGKNKMWKIENNRLIRNFIS